MENLMVIQAENLDIPMENLKLIFLWKIQWKISKIVLTGSTADVIIFT